MRKKWASKHTKLAAIKTTGPNMTDPDTELQNAKASVQSLADMLRNVGDTETINEERAEEHAEAAVAHIKHRNDNLAEQAMGWADE